MLCFACSARLKIDTAYKHRRTFPVYIVYWKNKGFSYKWIPDTSLQYQHSITHLNSHYNISHGSVLKDPQPVILSRLELIRQWVRVSQNQGVIESMIEPVVRANSPKIFLNSSVGQPSECCPQYGQQMLADGISGHCERKAFVTVAVKSKETVQCTQGLRSCMLSN